MNESHPKGQIFNKHFFVCLFFILFNTENYFVFAESNPLTVFINHFCLCQALITLINQYNANSVLASLAKMCTIVAVETL